MVDRLGMLAFLIIGCSAPEASIADKHTKAPPEMGGDQYALLADILAAQAEEPEAQPARFDEVARDWNGRRVRWEVAILAPLCERPSTCVALPFDRAQLEERSGQGWLPRLELDPAEHARMREACAGETTCVVAIEARVDRVRLSTELPTAVTLGEARLISARPPAPEEAWARRPG